MRQWVLDLWNKPQRFRAAVAALGVGVSMIPGVPIQVMGAAMVLGLVVAAGDKNPDEKELKAQLEKLAKKKK